jgi:hypothetical protein
MIIVVVFLIPPNTVFRHSVLMSHIAVLMLAGVFKQGRTNSEDASSLHTVTSYRDSLEEVWTKSLYELR